MLYNSVSSSVLTNGWLTSFICLRRSLRQGCALSMPLYVLTAEALAINIRGNSKIHGLLPPGPTDVEVKLTQFADDSTLLLVDDDSIAEAFRTFDLYEGEICPEMHTTTKMAKKRTCWRIWQIWRK